MLCWRIKYDDDDNDSAEIANASSIRLYYVTICTDVSSILSLPDSLPDVANPGRTGSATRVDSSNADKM